MSYVVHDNFLVLFFSVTFTFKRAVMKLKLKINFLQCAGGLGFSPLKFQKLYMYEDVSSIFSFWN